MSGLAKHLPKEAENIAIEQGWDSESILVQLIGFVRDNVPDHENKLARCFRVIADEENEDAERLMS